MRVKVMVDALGIEKALKAIAPAPPLLKPEDTKTFVVADLPADKIEELRGQGFVIREDPKFDMEVG